MIKFSFELFLRRFSLQLQVREATLVQQIFRANKKPAYYYTNIKKDFVIF